MSNPHPFSPNPRSIGGRICLSCGKTRTHNDHLDMGVEEPSEQEVEQMTQSPPGSEEIGGFGPEVQGSAARDYARSYAEQSKRDESNFSITSSGGYTTVQIKVAGPVTPKLLLAASAFMEEVQPKTEEAK